MLKKQGIQRKWYWMPTAVFFLGALSTVLLFWIYSMGERQRKDFEQVDDIMDIQVRTATFHLWFEEAITKGKNEDMAKTFADLDAAMRFSDALLTGGVGENGTVLTPFEDPALLDYARSIRYALDSLKEIALKRAQNPGHGAIGSALDNQFNTVFGEFQRNARALELAVEKDRLTYHAEARRLFIATVLIWIFIVTGSMLGLYTRERGRRLAEQSLKSAYEEMEERVKTRTAELANTNSQLRDEINERKKIEDSLRESESGFRSLSLQFHTLLDAIPDSITLVSSDLRVQWANREAAPAGLAPDVAGQYCYSVRLGAAAPCNDCPALRSFKTGKAECSQITRPDGSIWDIRTVPMRGEDGRMENVIEIATDITEKTALQAESMRAAHLASIGELAAGVAHEINNPINGIINYAQMMIDDRAAAHADREIPSRIMKEGDRVATIVRSLLSFAVERKEEKRPVRVQEILADTLALSATQLRKEGILLKVNIPENLPKIAAHAQQIQQVFLNIINNARYALNRKYPGTSDEKILEILGEEAASSGGRQVKITFCDRGTGIPADKIGKVIDPFFTTKPRGVGTGLGLSISHGIISDHGGKLQIQSVEGQYTKVHILLPAAGEARWTSDD
jgi:C4-dicarboxylate-specific signal transduction histidine kinase